MKGASSRCTSPSHLSAVPSVHLSHVNEEYFTLSCHDVDPLGVC